MDVIERVAGGRGKSLRVDFTAEGGPRGKGFAAQLFFRGEVVEERALGHPRPAADFIEARRAETALQHELASGLEEALPGLGGVAVGACGHTDWLVCSKTGVWAARGFSGARHSGNAGRFPFAPPRD